jgi:hypothetical protein
MFWISYFVTFVLASAIAIVLMAVRLVLSAVRRAFGLIPPQCRGNDVTHCAVMSAQSRRWSS